MPDAFELEFELELLLPLLDEFELELLDEFELESELRLLDWLLLELLDWFELELVLVFALLLLERLLLAFALLVRPALEVFGRTLALGLAGSVTALRVSARSGFDAAGTAIAGTALPTESSGHASTAATVITLTAPTPAA